MIEKVNLEQTLDRQLAYCERRLQDGILATLPVPATDRAADRKPDAGETRVRGCLLLEDLDGYLLGQQRQNVRDWLCDVIPTLYPTGPFGESVWTGMLGGDILFAGNNLQTWSYSPRPVIEAVGAFDFPEIATDNFWFGKMLHVTEYFVAHLKPVYDVQPFIFMDCLNLLVELRGASAAYTDLYDYPDFVREFAEWSIRENIRVYDAQAALTKDFVREAYGGHPCYRYARCNVPDLSVDAYGMCRREVYESVGLEQHRTIVGHYGGGRLHLHGNGRHLCRLVSSIEGLTECYMGDDVGYPPAYEIVEQLRDDMYPVPIRLWMPKEVFVSRLQKGSLPGGVAYAVSSAESAVEANDLMLRVFDYQPRSRC